MRCDYNEQYSSRTSLRINNIPLPDDENETAEDVMVKVKSLIRETGVDIPDTFLDPCPPCWKKDNVRRWVSKTSGNCKIHYVAPPYVVLQKS